MAESGVASVGRRPQCSSYYLRRRVSEQVCVLPATLAPVQSTSHFYHLDITRKNNHGSNHSRNRDSGSSCVALGKLFNLSGLPVYSPVNQYVHLITPYILQPTAVLQSTFTHFSTFDF